MTQGMSFVLASLAALFAAMEQLPTARVKAACKTHFYKFCPSYKVGRTQLKACMRAAGGNFSSRCIDALADPGEISRSQSVSSIVSWVVRRRDRTRPQ